MTKSSKSLRGIINKLKRNRIFRLALRALKLMTLFLFGICIVSFISAATEIFTIGDAYIEVVMRWALFSLLGAIALLLVVILLTTIYDYVKLAQQRRQQAKLNR